MSRRQIRVFCLIGFILIAFVIAAAGCQRAAPDRELGVYAAASLSEAFAEVGADFERAHPGVKVSFSFASSRRLVAQLALGARADVFAAASPREIESARAQNLAEGAPSTFAFNRIVVALPKENHAEVSGLADLARPGLRLAMADAAVPVGAYTHDVLTKMAAAEGTGPDFRRQVMANVISQDDDAKQVVAKVSLGEVDAGFVYASDALAAGLPTIEVPSAYNVEAAYLVVALRDGQESELARLFMNYVLSAEGQDILAKHGFAPAAGR